MNSGVKRGQEGSTNGPPPQDYAFMNYLFMHHRMLMESSRARAGRNLTPSDPL
jgi:hypothetical protein